MSLLFGGVVLSINALLGLVEMSKTRRVPSTAVIIVGATWLALGYAFAMENVPLSIGAEQLAKEYKEDATAADKNYKGKMLLLEGKIDSIGSKDLNPNPIALLWGFRGEALEAPTLLMCVFAKEHQEAVDKLKKGDKVQIEGKCEGILARRFVILKGCKFAK